jgi:hypothetical protein
MKDVGKLKSLIESRGGKTRELSEANIRLELGYDLDEMRRNGHDPSIIEEHRAFNEHLEKFIGSSAFGKYLAHLTPQQTYVASGIHLLPLQDIKESIVRGAAPCGTIFPHGYLIFASSIGGNAVCFHEPSAEVVWVDHTSFSDDSISYQERTSGEWKYLDFTEENIGKAAVPLSDDFESFLSALLNNRLEDQLDELD